MDRSVDLLESYRPMSPTGVILSGFASASIMVAVSVFIAAGPSPGYRTGYDAAIGKRSGWIQSAVDVAGVTALAVCDRLHVETTGGTVSDYLDFMSGCSAGIDARYGRHVPLLHDQG